ncbi:hypothetical protein NUW58_g2258 [Xylaria curta]|uniref:Uncharacterized protein n=2 Tax=Xylaria curta TaxID=42375 RepID=A0ACC1PC18_9PEZI|nr:hypothetical protein NUW58_g3211 [Xylaria curta]KAJ2992170.1 hypothetical protein NUW58_g2258 [Xylaria curta]
MAFDLNWPPLHSILDLGLLSTALIATATYAIARSIYLLNFHPLSRFPGPKIAAVSNVWYAYHWLSGRWPWAVEACLKSYGDIVRIAPNELVFASPKAFTDIYTSHDKGLETFHKTDIHDFARDRDGGLIWEQDPVKHRKVAKQMAPAFSAKATRSKDPTLHKYVNLFVEKMKEVGEKAGGVSLPTWIQWLAMDIAADMAYHHEVNCMGNEKDSAYLGVTLSFNKFVTMTQVLRRFPALSFLRFVVFPVSLMGKLMELRKTSLAELHRRITLQGATEHLDYFGQLVPADGYVPDTDNPKEILHLSKIATQLMFAGYLPPSDWYYGAFFHLLHNREYLDILTQEIRESFASYDEITPNAAASLPYLNACLKESLRLFNTSAVINGMPVYSPGAVVHGHYIPKGTTCQFSSFSVSRSSRYFCDAHQYRPQRWLAAEHGLFEARFANDDLDAFSPFSQGPRICVGKEIAWWQARLVMAKILWTFNVQVAPGQIVNLETDLKAWGYWVKPELRVRFLTAQ